MQQQQQQQYPPNAAYPPPGYAPAGQPGPPPGYAPAGQPGQPMGQYGQPGQPMGQPMAPGYAGPPLQQQQHVNTVIVQQQQNVVAMRFGETPCPMTCHYCSASIVTSTSKVVGSMVWMWVCGICLIGCLAGGATWFGCCLIPCCISSMKDTEHHCPNCNRMVGTHSKRI